MYYIEEIREKPEKISHFFYSIIKLTTLSMTQFGGIIIDIIRIE
jgi:hypothetical protein